ncbi:uncharacterized protein LOC119095345, partial [Pollicipes pollicipes]|uniref:uncharacterized protein LOC119095345 n=1 Tax=Pollicipes pollicipes TaxID=41117 RepID=UPI001885843C
MGNKASTATQWEVPNSDTGSLDHRSQQGPAAHVERWAEQMDTLNAARERQAVIQEATTVGRRVTPHITFNPPAPSVPPARPAPPAPRAPRLPELCSRHGSREGCVDANCRRLHLCHLFLADICKFGDACRNGHSLTTVHNQVVCNRFGLDTSRELAAVQMLRLAFQETGRMPDEIRHKYLDVCYKAGSPNPCQEPLCNRLHICRMFVTGRCNRPACKHGHDLHTTHNNDVLSRHKATRLSDAAILDLLREKCSGRRQVQHRHNGVKVLSKAQRETTFFYSNVGEREREREREREGLMRRGKRAALLERPTTALTGPSGCSTSVSITSAAATRRQMAPPDAGLSSSPAGASASGLSTARRPPPRPASPRPRPTRPSGSRRDPPTATPLQRPEPRSPAPAAPRQLNLA